MRDIILKIMDEAIVEQIKARKETDETYEEIVKRLREALKLIDKYKGKSKFTDKQFKEIQMITCFENLGYCCGLSKPCYFRDTVLYILGISKEQFKEKEKWIYAIKR